MSNGADPRADAAGRCPGCLTSSRVEINPRTESVATDLIGLWDAGVAVTSSLT